MQSVMMEMHVMDWKHAVPANVSQVHQCHVTMGSIATESKHATLQQDNARLVPQLFVMMETLVTGLRHAM